jgi:cation:H+ antiporter
MLALLQIIGGLILLVGGGELLVRGAVAIAKNLGITTIVIGLTVVAFGTSAPETFISIQAALSNHPDIAIGNVIGSNIANILLVVGTTAIIAPVVIHKQLARRDGTVMLCMGILMVIVAMNGRIGSFEGMILLLLITAYTLHTIRDVKENRADTSLLENIEEETAVEMASGKAVLYCLGGVVLLSGGSHILIEGSVWLATYMGLSEAVIGATIIAVGGSTPELVTSVVAAIRRHGDIGLANVVGSNIFNSSAVLGFAALASPLSVAEQFREVDFWVMLLVTALFLVFMLVRKEIGRFSGMTMLAGYLVYLGWQYNVIT